MKSPRSTSKPTVSKRAVVQPPPDAGQASVAVIAGEAQDKSESPDAEVEAGSQAGTATLSQTLLGMGVTLEGRVLLLGARRNEARIWGGEIPAEVALTLSSDFGVRGKGEFDIVILDKDASNDGLGPIHDRLQWAASHVSAGGRVILAVGTLAAPLGSQGKEGPVGPYDGLLFPEAIAAGDAGARRARITPLAASTWLLLARSVGLACIGQSGVGETPLPQDIASVHEQRLAVFDHHELQTGRVILILSKSGGVR